MYIKYKYIPIMISIIIYNLMQIVYFITMIDHVYDDFIILFFRLIFRPPAHSRLPNIYTTSTHNITYF